MTSKLYLYLLLLCIAQPLYAKEQPISSDFRYTAIKNSAIGAVQTIPPFHPLLLGRYADNKLFKRVFDNDPNLFARKYDDGTELSVRVYEYTMLSVQDEDLLRVVFYHPDGMEANAFDVHNPSKRDFSGMPARLEYRWYGIPYDEKTKTPGEQIWEKDLVVFADGTELEPYLPPDALPTNSGDLQYYLRWRKVYGNYYFVTLYRSAEILVSAALMTEKKGQNLLPVLGESSATADMSKYFIIGSHEPVILEWPSGEKRPRLDMTLIRVEEKDLPPDFPKGLVRWIP